MTSLNREQFIKEMATRYDFTQKDTKMFLDAFCELVELSLKDNVTITLTGFGKFSTTEQKARSGKLGDKEWSTDACIQPKFTFAKPIKDSFKGK